MSPEARSTIASLVTKAHAKSPDSTEATSQQLARLMVLSVASSGLLSSEITPPTGNGDTEDWTLVQRFRSAEELESWKANANREKLIQELSGSSGTLVAETVISGEDPEGSVATAIITHVKPGMEKFYSDWEVRIQSTQAAFPGYRGSYLQPPTAGSRGFWMTVLRFDTPESLDEWFASDQRRKLMEEVKELVTSKDFHGVRTSFPGWVPIDPKTGDSPPNWKTSLLVLMVLYPIVTLEIKHLSPVLSSLHFSVGTFLSLVLSLALTTWVAMPLAVRLFDWWLLPEPAGEASTNLKGILLLTAIFAAEITTVWAFL